MSDEIESGTFELSLDPYQVPNPVAAQPQQLPLTNREKALAVALHHPFSGRYKLAEAALDLGKIKSVPSEAERMVAAADQWAKENDAPPIQVNRRMRRKHDANVRRLLRSERLKP